MMALRVVGIPGETAEGLHRLVGVLRQIVTLFQFKLLLPVPDRAVTCETQRRGGNHPAPSAPGAISGLGEPTRQVEKLPAGAIDVYVAIRIELQRAGSRRLELRTG